MRTALRSATALTTSVTIALIPAVAPAQSLTVPEAQTECLAAGVQVGEGRVDACIQALLAGQDLSAAAAAGGVTPADEPALTVPAAQQQCLDAGVQVGAGRVDACIGSLMAGAGIQDAVAAGNQAGAEAEAAAQADAERAAAAAAAEAEAEANREAAAREAEADAARQAQAERDAQAEREAAAAREAQAARDAEAALTVPQAQQQCLDAGVEVGEGRVDACITTLMSGADLQAGIEAAAARDRALESRLADEVAARGAPTLSAEQQEAAQRTADALFSGGDRGGEEAPAAAASGGSQGTVTEQTVTDADVRSSSEDFETGAVESSDGGGLSNAQKFALGALGALAVGTVLNSRNRVVSNSGDRVVVQQDDGALTVLKDDDALLRQAGSNVRTESFDDGSTRTIVTREDGSQVITVRDASLRVLRRVLVQTDGSEYTLIDDTEEVAPVDVASLPVAPVVSTGQGDDPLRAALRREAGLDRRFSLAQVRNISEVRALAPAFEVSEVTFASGSAAITPEQAGNLTGLAREVLAAIRANPREVFLIEGHTDAVGDAAYNLALSDRRAETLALALNEYFDVPVENMVVQGYGERFLKVSTQADERANRRATVRQITQLLQTAAAE
ncbi:OmpA family protein [Jannaschia sp. 2305UL9-9]|uniref:OmpA family protein n=1 Tax=Jannaschia sp. 2305UL9-9 TaxID=3121638 RepID=UPI0035272545